MNILTVLALIVAFLILMIPVGIIWYINIMGIIKRMKDKK